MWNRVDQNAVYDYANIIRENYHIYVQHWENNL